MATGTDPARVRRNYGFRSSDPETVHREFDSNGFVRIPPAAAEPGDLLAVRTGPAQLHIILVTDLGYLHADAGLRRVVEAPGPVPWPVLSAWRCPDDPQSLPGIERSTPWRPLS